MGFLSCFQKGSTIVSKRVKILIYLWVINVSFSLMVIAPIHALIKNDVSHSLMGDRLLEGLDFLWLGDVIYKFQNLVPMLAVWLAIPTLLHMLFYTFLNGGIIGSLKESQRKVTLKNFLTDCDAYAWKFFKLFLLSIPVYFIVIGLIYRLIGQITGLFTKNASTEWPLLVFSNVKTILFLLLFSVVNMFFDYAKIHLLFTRGRSVLKEAWITLQFLFSRFFRAWILYLFIALLGLLLFFIYMEIAYLLPKNHTLPILIVFIWQQMYIFSRLWIKLNFFASQMEFYRQGKTP